MKKLSFIAVLLFAVVISCASQTTKGKDKGSDKKEASIEKLTTETFKQKIMPYKTGQNTWNYVGKKPAIIDFYADWCRPCRMLAPELQKIADKYDGQIVVYKIDTEDQRELAGLFAVSSIPALLFIPMEGQPTMLRGYQDFDALDKTVQELLIPKKSNKK